MAAPAACAESLRLQGRVDLNLTRQDGRALQVQQASTSYLGLTLSQAAGQVQAVAELQAGFDADSGQPDRRFFGRESWVGLQGQHGEARWRWRLGRSRSPLQRVVSAHDPHGTDGVGSPGTSALLLGHGLSRVDNSVLLDVEPARHWALSASVATREAASQPGWQALRLRWAPPDHEWNLAVARRGAADDAAMLAWRATTGVVQPTVLAAWGQRQAVPQRVWLLGARVQAGGLHWRVASTWRRAGSAPAQGLHSLGADRPLSGRSLLYVTWARGTGGGDGAAPAAAPAGSALEVGVRHRF